MTFTLRFSQIYFRGSEDDTDYFDDRYCSWDGFECHNSLPCKQTQQARCEDLGYDWYEATALDVMRQAPEDLGIPLDLSSSYPIERKGMENPWKVIWKAFVYIPIPNTGILDNRLNLMFRKILWKSSYYD